MLAILPNMLIVAISRNGKVIIPHGDTTIQAGDALYVIGEKGPILDLNEKVHEKENTTTFKKVMIIGGGKTGFYLAKCCSEFGAAVVSLKRKIAVAIFPLIL